MFSALSFALGKIKSSGLIQTVNVNPLLNSFSFYKLELYACFAFLLAQLSHTA